MRNKISDRSDGQKAPCNVGMALSVDTALREGDWKLIRLPERLPTLYHLSDDISEQNDVALQNLERTKTMLKKLGTGCIVLGSPLRIS